MARKISGDGGDFTKQGIWYTPYHDRGGYPLTGTANDENQT